MPWKVSVVMDEKMKFIARLLEGEKMAVLCREFDISRKTGYKFWDRYQKVGMEGLNNRSQRPHRYANQLPMQVEKAILGIKKERPTWGAPKIRAVLARRYPEVKTPAKSTVHAVLDRHGWVRRRRKRRFKAQGTLLSRAKMPNDLWCADYKGEFMLGNQKYCYLLTLTDYASRYLLTCEALETTKEVYALSLFEKTFKAYGLPRVIRTDNGIPFSSCNALFGLSKLSVWWLRLGIEIERIQPGHPQENGRHERMHLTLKKEATNPAGANFLQQQEKFDRFRQVYNQERPHQALGMKYPGEVYTPSLRPYQGLPEAAYPLHDKTITVTHCGRICYKGYKVSLSRSFAGQAVGIREVSDKLWLVSFMRYDLGYFDETSHKIEPLEGPFGSQVTVSPMSPV